MYILKAYCRKEGYPVDFVTDEHGNYINYVEFGWVCDMSFITTGALGVATNLSLALRCATPALATEVKQRFDDSFWCAEIIDDDEPVIPDPLQLIGDGQQLTLL